MSEIPTTLGEIPSSFIETCRGDLYTCLKIPVKGGYDDSLGRLLNITKGVIDYALTLPAVIDLIRTHGVQVLVEAFQNLSWEQIWDAMTDMFSFSNAYEAGYNGAGVLMTLLGVGGIAGTSAGLVSKVSMTLAKKGVKIEPIPGVMVHLPSLPQGGIGRVALAYNSEQVLQGVALANRIDQIGDVLKNGATLGARIAKNAARDFILMQLGKIHRIGKLFQEIEYLKIWSPETWLAISGSIDLAKLGMWYIYTKEHIEAQLLMAEGMNQKLDTSDIPSIPPDIAGIIEDIESRLSKECRAA